MPSRNGNRATATRRSRKPWSRPGWRLKNNYHSRQARRSLATIVIPGRAPRREGKGTQLSQYAWCQVIPHPIVLLDQPDFPRPVPALDLLLAGDGVINIREFFKPDQDVHAICSREAGNDFILMLYPYALAHAAPGRWSRRNRACRSACWRAGKRNRTCNQQPGSPSLAALTRGSPGMTVRIYSEETG